MLKEKVFYLKRKKGGDVYVTVVKEKISGKYLFFNITKNHICPCRFNTIEEALEEMYEDKNIINIKEYNEE